MRGQPIPMSVQGPGRLAFPDVMFTPDPTSTAKGVLPSMSEPTHAAPVRANASPQFSVTGTAEAGKHQKPGGQSAAGIVKRPL